MKNHADFHESNQIHPTAIIFDNVTLGKNNIIGPYTVIGSNGEIRNQKEFHGTVIIGDNNTISELVTIQRPAIEGQSTIIGNNNLIMAHSHIGHDAKVGNDCEICSGVILGGYCVIEDNVKLKLGVIVRNRKTVHKGALAGLGSAVIKDVEAHTVVFGVPAKNPLASK